MNSEARDFLRYGVARRLNIIEITSRKIFELFPPEQNQVLPLETIHEVQAFLHAFLINVCGIFDNFSWAFIHRHDLFQRIGGRNANVGIFRAETQQCFPPELSKYVAEKIKPWNEKYMKDYRDAIAHRIPLYVPPYTIDPKDHDSYKQLNELRGPLLQDKQWNELNRNTDQMEALGKPMPVFLDDFSKYVPFHPQLNADTALVLEFTHLFYSNWHLLTSPK